MLQGRKMECHRTGDATGRSKDLKQAAHRGHEAVEATTFSVPPGVAWPVTTSLSKRPAFRHTSPTHWEFVLRWESTLCQVGN